MAAYAALVSLMHIVDQIQHHPHPPITLDKNQVQSLMDKVTFLQEFLEVYSHVCNKEADELHSRITKVAYEAEDVIESYIADQILAQTKTHEDGIISTPDFSLALQRVIQSMDLIEKEVMRIKEMGSVQVIQVHRSSYIPMAGSSRSPLKGKNIMVGFDDILIQLMDQLTGQHSNRQIIPIVGMGGIGKTTLAKNAYENSLIVEHFDIRVWITISQEYNVREILSEALSCLKNQVNKEISSGTSEDKLGEFLYKCLCGRRYLVIMDDMWSVEAWYRLKVFFPENYNGSRVIITTRLSNIALDLPSAHGLKMNFLDGELSWNLLCKIVFRENGCPLELEEIGRKIARNCKGLPLSIVVIGGLLEKSEKTREYWEDIAENLNSIVNLEDCEHCLKLLYMSYNHLPIHLKPCFLYLGFFPEDKVIRVSDLIKLWVSEGFLKPIIGKSLEQVAQEYLNDLIDRNLILTLRWKSNGKVKFCKIHDLLRDLCLREAYKEKFLCVTKLHSLNEQIDTIRRIAIHGSILDSNGKYGLLEIHDPLQDASLVRSLICESPAVLTDFKLLRVLKLNTHDYLRNIFHRKVNLRYTDVTYLYGEDEMKAHLSKFPSCVYRLWNLQTLSYSFISAIEIWKMPLLRHVKFDRLSLLDPSSEIDFVLENLQTLSNVLNFRCSEKMVKMIPNIKKLKITYDKKFEGSHYCLNNLEHLHELETLGCYFESSVKPSRSDLMQNLTFPHSLKKLSLQRCYLRWEDISTKIGSLPLLQVLKLSWQSAAGAEWKTVEGQFCSLKYLLIGHCGDLERWTTDSTHFPCLEHVVLKGLYKLKEIPSIIGEIPMLQSIKLYYCSDSAIFSAKKIVEEQKELGNESLQVQVRFRRADQVPESLASHNFQVECEY